MSIHLYIYMYFKAKLRESGNSIIITIPKDFVDSGMLKIGKIYVFDTDGIDIEDKENEDESNITN